MLAVATPVAAGGRRDYSDRANSEDVGVSLCCWGCKERIMSATRGCGRSVARGCLQPGADESVDAEGVPYIVPTVSTRNVTSE